MRQVEGLDDKTAQKVDFYTRQFVDAMAPSNFVLTNPRCCARRSRAAARTWSGACATCSSDLERGKGQLAIKMTDLEAFKVGENIAVTPGKVVFQNDLMQLIQYAPTTETVRKRPLLIMPPWINKFYILDLREKNSFVTLGGRPGPHRVRGLLGQPRRDARATRRFEDYMLEGPLAALDAIEEATGEREVNVIGYCLGGTLLAATLAYMAAKGDDRVAQRDLLHDHGRFRRGGRARASSSTRSSSPRSRSA